MNLSLTVYYHNFFRAVFLSENIECRIKKIKYFQQQQISPKTNNWQKFCIKAVFCNALWNKIRKLHILTDLHWFAKLPSCLKSYITNAWKKWDTKMKKICHINFFTKWKCNLIYLKHFLRMLNHGALFDSYQI